MSVAVRFSALNLHGHCFQEKLWSLDQNFDESLKLLDETEAAIKMLQHGSFCLDLSSIHISLVNSPSIPKVIIFLLTMSLVLM